MASMRLHPIGLALGLGMAFLVMGVVTLFGWALLAVLGRPDPATTAAIVGAPLGVVAGGWLAGKTTLRPEFHGALTGVLFAGIVTVLSVLDGSPASAGTMALFLIIGVVLGLVGGWVARRGKNARG